ncbi:hypothetical protein GCM10023228_10130 [Brevibacillus fulvus]|uniref:Amidohydrolase YtcJ n=1 Tax=Brevibacillus fulvus TaxID=1125967 RepID=A0A938XYX3_9BACL|nr:putative amidohydrolase YtcJ [Brevibacillus fulvus]
MTTIFRNGFFHTLNPAKPLVESVVVQDGKIVDLGSEDDMLLQWGRNDVKVINLEGKFVTPGLIDSHLHLSGLAMSFLSVDLSQATSKEELLLTVKKKAAQTAEGVWIQGRGWDENRFCDHLLPTIAELD